jgi:2-dehydro-3-deoxyphosphogluconate aldolase/(4S)-4-hydroxy-2-oxoglutarate aldolase
MNKKDFVRELICKERLLPLYYYDSSIVSIDVLRVLYRSGIKIVEYTNRGINALDNFIAMRKVVNDEMPEMQLGAGTIKSAVDAELFIAAGADFIICPVVNPEVALLTHKAGLLWIPGCMTTTEIFTAEANGATIIKIFPGSILGPSYIAAIREIFPNLLFMPTGGVDIKKENLSAWFDAGVCAVGLGSKLIDRSALDNNDYDKIASLTKEALHITRAIG